VRLPSPRCTPQNCGLHSHQIVQRKSTRSPPLLPLFNHGVRYTQLGDSDAEADEAGADTRVAAAEAAARAAAARHVPIVPRAHCSLLCRCDWGARVCVCGCRLEATRVKLERASMEVKTLQVCMHTSCGVWG
jgi:hypothetical protein